MLAFALLGFALAFGLLMLDPVLSTWIGNAIGEPGVVKAIWWVAQWPVLVGGLLLAFAGILYLGPNVEHPPRKFLSFGATFSVVIWLVADVVLAERRGAPPRRGDPTRRPSAGGSSGAASTPRSS